MKKTEQTNELYVIHFHGELLEPNVWKKYSSKYGGLGMHGWRAPKKVYYKIHHARSAMRHLPKEIQADCEIVRYIPGEVVEHSSDTEAAYQERKRQKQIKFLERQKEQTKREIEYHQRELANLLIKAAEQKG